MTHVIVLCGYPYKKNLEAHFVKEPMEMVAGKKGLRVTYLAIIPKVPFFLKRVPRYFKYLDIPAEIPNDHYKVWRLPIFMPIPGGKKVWPLNALQIAANAYPLIRRAMAEHPGDRFILHTHWVLPVGLAGLILARRFSLPHICTARRGMMREESAKSTRLRYLYRKVLKNITSAVAVSDDLRDQIKELSPETEVDVIMNGTNRGLFYPLNHDSRTQLRRNLMGEMADQKLVLAVRVTETSKGLWELLEAFKKVRKNDNPFFLALIAIEKEIPKAKEFIKAEGLEKWVYIPDNWLEREEVIPWFQAADIFVLPSYFEGMPNSMIEAMMCEVPVAVTPVGGVPSVLHHGETGFSLKLRSSDSIVEALELLLERPEWYASTTKAAADFVQENYDMQKMADRFAELYHSVASKGRRMTREAEQVKP